MIGSDWARTLTHDTREALVHFIACLARDPDRRHDSAVLSSARPRLGDAAPTSQRHSAMCSRRQILKDVLPGAIVAVAGFAAIGRSIAPSLVDAMLSDVVTVRPHRHMRSRHRRWGCWWQRGRRWWHWGHRVCGWR